MKYAMKSSLKEHWKQKSLGVGLAAAMALISVGSLWAATEEMEPVDLAQAEPEGGEAAPIRVEPVTVTIGGESQDGISVEFEHRKDARNSLQVRTDVSGVNYNTLVFNVNFGQTDPSRHGFGVWLIDRDGNWASTSFGKHAKKLEEGWYEFAWDLVNQPDVDQGLNPENIRTVRIRYNFESIPENQKDTVTFADMRFVSGRTAQAGDPELYKEWVAYAQAYRPDYSDSSKFLLPPETGRINPPLALTNEGKPLGEIVLEAGASETETLAAGELQRWLKEITGAELPIVQAPTDTAQVKILLGTHFAESRYAEDLKALADSDGFAVRTEGKNISIFGAIPKGTMNGVFSFIENNTDLIWARPHPDHGTIFSQEKNLEIVWADALERPAATIRGWFPNLGGELDFWLWSDRNRNNYLSTGNPKHNLEWGDIVEFGGGHNLQFFIPKDDPAYFPTIEGSKPEKLSIWKHQICMSVPNLEETYAKNVVNYLSEKAPPGIEVFNIKIEDNWGVCECEKCVAPITLADGSVVTIDDPAFRSTQFYQFLNKVTSIINETFPDLKIQTYAYFFTSTPPKVALNPNIVILFCPYVRKDHRTPLCSPANDHWWRMLKTWGEATPNVLIREYYGILNQGRPLAEVVAFDVRNALKLNVRGFGSEINPDFVRKWWDGEMRGGGDEFDVDMMDYWIINRLYWNPNAKVEDLRKYFIRRTFREAAPEMEKFFGTIREHWYTQRGASTWGSGKRLFGDKILAEGKVDEMRARLTVAASLATHPVSKTLIERISQRFEGYLKEAGTPAIKED